MNVTERRNTFTEDLFTVGTRLGELSRLTVMVAEDTEERAYSEEDVIRNMGSLRVIADELTRLEHVCEKWDEIRVKYPDKLAKIL